MRGVQSGPNYFVEVDVVMDANTPLWKAHDLSQQLQDRIEVLPNVERAFVHVDHETSHAPVGSPFWHVQGSVMLLTKHKYTGASEKPKANHLVRLAMICGSEHKDLDFLSLFMLTNFFECSQFELRRNHYVQCPSNIQEKFNFCSYCFYYLTRCYINTNAIALSVLTRTEPMNVRCFGSFRRVN